MFEQRFFHRMIFLGILMALLTLVLAGRMYYLQISEGQHYRALAEGNRIALQPNLSLRGQVFDRNGVPLAQNQATFQIVLLKEKGTDIDQALDKLSQFITFTQDEIASIYERSKRKRGLEPFVLKDLLTWEQVSAIELNLADLPGISVEVGHMRLYPTKEVVAHVLGYVSAPSEKEQEEDRVLEIPGLSVGKIGIEKQLDKALRGTPGHKQLEVNAGRRIVRELSNLPGKPGKELTLSLDLRLQNYIAERLGEHESGSAVVMDIDTGEVLAFVSHPSFDPNLFVDGISHANWRSLMDNPYIPLTNKAVAGSYPPGSTLKMLVVIAALNEGVVTPKTTFHCPGYMYVGNHKFHCWRKHGHGSVDAKRAIVESCDVYFYEVSKKLDIEKLKSLYEMFGLHAKHLPGFPHERKGFVPSREWKMATRGERWTVSDTILTSIGQGAMQSTPMQLAVVAARLASGKKVEPQLVTHEHPSKFESLPLNPAHLQLAQKAMKNVINAPNGTAFRFHLKDAAFAGKTGTSQVRRITLKDRQRNLTKTHHLDWKYREHGLFLGHYPADKPKYAISVVLEHCAGGSHAARAARDIVEKIHELEAENDR